MLSFQKHPDPDHCIKNTVKWRRILWYSVYIFQLLSSPGLPQHMDLTHFEAVTRSNENCITLISSSDRPRSAFPLSALPLLRYSS